MVELENGGSAISNRDNIYESIKGKTDFVLLETSKIDPQNDKSLLFLNPITVLILEPGDDVGEFFLKIDSYLKQGYYLAGYFSYELGYYLECSFKGIVANGNLACLGVYRDPIIVRHPSGFINPTSLSNSKNLCLDNLHFTLEKEIYLNQIAKIKEYIAAGDTYQINFTAKYKFGFNGSALRLYTELKRRQPVPYGAFLNIGKKDIISLSPELFFSIDQNEIRVKPMKGTAARGRFLDEDRKIAKELAVDEKNCAENLMIVDLLRNDLGRICKTGTIQVEKMFEVEQYPTLLQMTSTIKGKLRPGLGYYEVFKSLFPCGSVTGAPKIKSMELIRDLEIEPRGVYTGAIGFFSPDGEARFNVAIRTLVLEEGRGELGVGSGIVFDSDPEGEYSETLLKSTFLTKLEPEFELLESILWDNGYHFLTEHLNRLQESTLYFGFLFNVEKTQEKLLQNANSLIIGHKYKVRIQVGRSGEINVENVFLPNLPAQSESCLVTLGEIRVNSSNRFLYHKTTRRDEFNQLYQTAASDGYYDVIFRNEHDEITEGAINNIFIVKDGIWYTPPVECGLLPGIYRQHIIDNFPNVKEAKLNLTHLRQADGVYLCNSVRGLVKVSIALN